PHAAREPAVHADAARRRAGRLRRRQHRRPRRGVMLRDGNRTRGRTRFGSARVSFFVFLFLLPGYTTADPAFLSAARTNDTAAVLAALDRGVNVNARAPDETTALHWTVYNDNAALVERLIAAG